MSFGLHCYISISIPVQIYPSKIGLLINPVMFRIWKGHDLNASHISADVARSFRASFKLRNAVAE